MRLQGFKNITLLLIAALLLAISFFSALPERKVNTGADPFIHSIAEKAIVAGFNITFCDNDDHHEGTPGQRQWSAAYALYNHCYRDYENPCNDILIDIRSRAFTLVYFRNIFLYIRAINAP